MSHKRLPIPFKAGTPEYAKAYRALRKSDPTSSTHPQYRRTKRLANLEERREYDRNYYAQNKDRLAEYRKEKSGDFPSRQYLARATKHLFWLTALRRQVYSALGGRCVRCGFDDVRALQIDHVGSDGAQHRRGKASTTYLREILAQVGSGRYQLLCANCNYIKRDELRECRSHLRARGYPEPPESTRL